MKYAIFFLTSFFYCFQAYATFSIVAVDPETGEVGSAGASCIDDNACNGCGGVVIISDLLPGKGAVNSQAYACLPNVNLEGAITQMEAGLSPEEIITYLQENDVCNVYDFNYRQYGIVDFDENGMPRSAGFTGESTDDYKGHITGFNYAIQGNILLNAEVLTNIEDAFLNTNGSLAEKLMAALQGANIAGADSRCLDENVSSQSSYIRVARPDDAPNDFYLNLIVSTTPYQVEPIDELQTLFDAWMNENVLPCALPDFGTSDICNEEICELSTSDFSETYTEVFQKYTYATNENNEKLLLLAQNNLTTEQINFAKNVLEQHLADVPNTLYGSDKSEVWEVMVENEAILALFNDEAGIEQAEDSDLFGCDINVQDLWGTEIILEGTNPYLADVRNAAFEEIAHLVQDYGIAEALPDMQNAIETATTQAMNSGMYQPLDDLEVEDYDNEYFALGVEVFYGLWEHLNTTGDNELPYTSRAEMMAQDPDLYEIITGFFTPFHTFEATIDPAFEGTFLLHLAENTNYTYRSQYLTKARLLGSNNASLTGNDEANQLTGNMGNNILEGKKGNDFLDGSEGEDVAVFTGEKEDYVFEMIGDGLIVEDNEEDRDGIDTLYNIEQIAFSDQDYTIGDLLSLANLERELIPFDVYPNPATAHFFITLKEDFQQIGQIIIEDVKGNEVDVLKNINSTPFKYNTGKLEAGIYLITLEVDGQRFSQKIVVGK